MILVTGASGFLGKAIVRRLSDLSLPYFDLTRGHLDLSGTTSLENWLDFVPDFVVHLAAVVPKDSKDFSSESFAVSTRMIDANVFAAVKSWRCPVIYASTCLLYRRDNPGLKTESSLISGRSGIPYSLAKLEGERLFHRLSNSVLLRLSSVIGPGITSQSVFSRFVSLALDEKPLPVMGLGSRTQDFIDVEDVVDFLIRAIASPRKGIYNVVSARPVSMRELATAVVATVGKGKVEVLGSGIPDPLEGERADYAKGKALRDFGWVPRQLLEHSIRRLAESRGV